MMKASLWDDLAAQVAAQADTRAWAPPAWPAFSRCKVLAFDPSLSATGWVHMRVTGWGAGHRVRLLGKGTLKITTTATGYLGTYERASRLRCLLQDLYWAEVDARHPSAIAWEAPAVHGRRLESSLIAGLQVYEMANRAGTVINANHASSLLTGSPLHDKGEISQAVARYLPGCLERTWNQHERDALAIGLAYSLDLPEDPVTDVDDDEDIY